MMVQRMMACIRMLPLEEQNLIRELFFRNKSERRLSAETGIPQMTLHYRQRKILKKLFKLFEKQQRRRDSRGMAIDSADGKTGPRTKCLGGKRPKRALARIRHRYYYYYGTRANWCPKVCCDSVIYHSVAGQRMDLRDSAIINFSGLARQYGLSILHSSAWHQHFFKQQYDRLTGRSSLAPVCKIKRLCFTENLGTGLGNRQSRCCTSGKLVSERAHGRQQAGADGTGQSYNGLAKSVILQPHRF